MAEAKTCIECRAPLPENVSEVFCPACALNRALAVGGLRSVDPPSGSPTSTVPPKGLLTWLHLLPSRLRSRGKLENLPKPLASPEARGSSYSSITIAEPKPGDFVEDYEILERVGGNMGLVFKARHRLLDKVVALKLLPVDWISDPARLARFQREMRVMGQLEHPNLVTAADARSVSSWHLVAMEWIDGIDLHLLVKSQGPLPVDAACEAARQAALGLHHAHQNGLIHRDIKPSNLMLTRSGTIKVIDMGLALIRDDSTAQLTHTGLVLGTMNYCAPEQFRDSSRVDIRADIYSLGCTLHHLITGKSPYWERKTLAEVVEAHLNQPLPCLAESRSDAPSGLQALLARMTAKEPADRFPTPGAVAAALEPFARAASLIPLAPKISKPVPRAPVDSGRISPTFDVRRPASGGAQPQPARWTRRAVFFGLLPAAAVTAILFRNRNGIETTDPNQLAAATEPTPVIVLMDTPADAGVYDPENRGRGITNAVVLQNVLDGLGRLHPELISSDSSKVYWRGEKTVLDLHPRLVLIHRSAFFHPINFEMGFGTPPEGDPLRKNWDLLYQVLDDKLVSFIGYVGTVQPRTHFLIYSRGTDPTWKTEATRTKWVANVSDRFPTLKNRVHDLYVQVGPSGSATFKDAAIAAELRNLVQKILKSS